MNMQILITYFVLFHLQILLSYYIFVECNLLYSLKIGNNQIIFLIKQFHIDIISIKKIIIIIINLYTLYPSNKNESNIFKQSGSGKIDINNSLNILENINGE